jgi:hypothetical protein
MEVSDLPTLFQISVAQETNAQSIESLHTLFNKQQEQVEFLLSQLSIHRQLIEQQQFVIDELVLKISEQTK